MDPSEEPSSVAWNVITVLMHLLSASILSFCLARRSFFHVGPKRLSPATRGSQAASSIRFHRPMPSGDERRPSVGTLDTLRKLTGSTRRLWRNTGPPNYTFQTTCARFTTFLALVSSFLFVFSSAVVLTGFGLNLNPPVPTSQATGPSFSGTGPTGGCQAAIYLCIFFYGLTKICIYVVLVERVYVVSGAGLKPPRMSTNTYKYGILGILVYIGIVILLVLSRISEVRRIPYPSLASPFTEPSIEIAIEVCTIGLHLWGVIPLLVYETILTIVLTAMFVSPILNSQGHGHKSRLCPCPLVRKLFEISRSSLTRPIPLLNLTRHAPDIRCPDPLANRPTSTSSRDDNRLNSGEASRNDDGPTSWGFELEHQGLQSMELSSLARRCLFGSLSGLIVTFANATVLASMNGREEVSVCMRWCLADVVINALAVYAVMQGNDDWWWVRDTSEAVPNVSLPTGLWSRADRGGTGGGGVATAPRDRKSRTTDAVSLSTIEKGSVGFLEEYTLRSGQTIPLSGGRFRSDDLISPLSPPARLAPIGLPHGPSLAHNVKHLSLQSNSRRPSSITTYLSGSVDSFGMYARKGKGKEESWISGLTDGSPATAQGHSVYHPGFTPSPSFLDWYSRDFSDVVSSGSSADQHRASFHYDLSPQLPPVERPPTLPLPTGELPPDRAGRWGTMQAPFCHDR